MTVQQNCNVDDGNLNRLRRNLLKAGLFVPLGAVVASLFTVTRSLASLSPQPAQISTSSSTAPSGFPRVKVANLSDLKNNAPLNFSYPLDDELNSIIKLGEKAKGGIGPDSDIVAFSLICQHLGCYYHVIESVGRCPCHGATYDLANGGNVTSGPALDPVPQVILELDSSTGDIYATGMGPPTIYGHGTGPDYVSNDLQGGTLVPEFPSLTLPFFAAFVLALAMVFTRRVFRQNVKQAQRRSG